MSKRKPSSRVTSRDNCILSTDRPLWVWLGGRHREAIALARRHPQWAELLRRGWRAEEIEQEVLLRIWERQERHQPYDPSRAGWGKYMTLLTGSILTNLLGKTTTDKAKAEDIGAVQVIDGEAMVVDAALVAVGELRPALSERGAAALSRQQEADEPAHKVVRKPSKRGR